MRAIRARCLLVTVLSSLGLAAALPVVTARADVPATDAGIQSGTPLPTRPQTGLRNARLLSTSDGYIEHEVAQPDESTPATLAVVRLSDGVTVRRVAATDFADSTYGSHVVDEEIVTVDRATGGGSGDWVVADPESGVERSRVDLGPYGIPIRVGAQWTLTYGMASESDPVSHDWSVDLVRPDGSHVEVHSADGSLFRMQDLTYVGGDDDTAYLRSSYTTVAVDIASAVASSVSSPDPTATDVAVTPHRLLFWKQVYASSGDHYLVSWLDRQDGGSGSFEVPFDQHDRGLVPLGDGVAELWLPDGGSASPLMAELRPIGSDGTVGQPVVTGIENALPTPDGRLVTVRGMEGSGEIVTVAAGSPATVTDVARLPVLDDQAVDVALSGGGVYATWDDTDQLFTHASGATGWSATDPATPADTISYPDRTFDQAGDEVLTRVSQGVGSNDEYELTWPGGRRFLSVLLRAASLGRGGQYLVRLSPDGQSQVVEDARTGAVVTQVGASVPVFVDRSTLWRVDGDGLRGVDLTGGAPDRFVAVPSSCRPDLELRAVNGRWAEIDCNGSIQILDLEGRMSPWPLPAQGAQLGDSTALGADSFGCVGTVAEGSGTDQVVLHVADFSAAHHERVYGPLRGQTFPPGSSFSFDDAGSHSLVYVDARSQVRSVDLGWVTVPTLTETTPTPPSTPTPVPTTPLPDVTGPVVAVVGAPAVAATLHGVLVFGFHATDPSGVMHYQARTRSATLGNPLGPWQQQPVSTTPSVAVSARAGDASCVSFRAWDSVGNVSDWSAERCTSLPTDDPSLGATGPHRRLHDARALGGSYTVLGRGSSARLPAVLGGAVTMWLFRSPGSGSCTVSIGGHTLGVVRLGAHRTAAATITLANPHGWTGTLRLRPTGDAPVRIDAVALQP